MRWMQASLVVVSAATALMAAGCSPQSPAVAATISDKVYSVTPDTLQVKAGIVSGEVTELKVMERVEDGSGKVMTPAKLTGKLVLKNVSADQSVRLLGGRILYVDGRGQPIKLDGERAEPTIRIATGYGASDRLDPGQGATHSLDAEFPVEALKAKKLKEIRVDLEYIPSAYRQETLKFPVSIGAQQP
jgi:hypothetical protein